MDTLTAYMKNQAAVARGARRRVFDWDKAATLIKEHQPSVAEAGLEGDWEWTGGVIYRGGKAVTSTSTFLASNWCRPMLEMDGDCVPCWKYADECDWHEKTKWPKSAKRILAAA